MPDSTGGRSLPDAGNLTFNTARATMVADIRAEAGATAQRTGRARFRPEVMTALAEVPRHEFVDADNHHRAYANAPLPIGCAQTISQPFLVALMTDLLELGPASRVLEIGMGSGYQTAILSKLAQRVYAVEIHEPLARLAGERLARLGYGNVSVRVGDGFAGWPEHAPYDGILVAAAIPEVPPPLIDQLKPGGRLVIPLGKAGEPQELVLVRRSNNGSVFHKTILSVAFVPFARGAGHSAAG